MSPPSFETIGSQVEEFTTSPPYYSAGSFFAYNNCCSATTSLKLSMPPFKDAELAFTYLQPASFGTKFTFPILMTSVQQEFSAALSNLRARKHSSVLFKDPALRSRSSYSSDNMVVDLVTECHGKKVKSYLALVLRDNFLVGPRFGVSLKKPSHWFHSLRRFSYGVLRRHPRFDVGLFSSFDGTSQQSPQLTIATSYKLNPWSFIKFCFTQNKLFAWNYGFTLLDEVLVTLGFSSDFGSSETSTKFNASVSIIT
ncbi:hypothetical protein TcWFU_001844 [Taenia crassiceps]|uniref:Uncharacterized protein n=1 Tax=Taenia crassiceps TaxID=6207 RepID=A0ABR4QJ60_9CEST